MAGADLYFLSSFPKLCYDDTKCKYTINYSTGIAVYGNTYRGFESHPLRL
jgi:hypothetical protein